MSTLCPKCHSIPDTLNEHQEGSILFSVNLNGTCSEKGEIMDQDPSGKVSGICRNCNHEWKINGITQANQFTDFFSKRHLFNLEKAMNGEPVQTKDGRKVTGIKIIKPDAPNSYLDVDEYKNEKYVRGLLVTIKNKNSDDEYPYYHDGGSHKFGLESTADLIMS